MAGFHGQFCWYELMTPDTAAAQAFYGAVLGWTAQPAGPGADYTLFSAGERPVAGLMTLPSTGRPIWVGYIAVDELDAATHRLQEAGGQVHRAAAAIPGVGRFAVVADPQGATFVLMQPEPRPMPPPLPLGTPGHAGWRELHAGDGKAAFEFYAGQFGWIPDQAVDMGPVGVYQTFAAGSAPIGGVMTKMPDMPRPIWIYYFNVESADAAADRIRENGGEVLMGPHEVPGGGWIVQGFDPQGAMFAVLAPRR